MATQGTTDFLRQAGAQKPGIPVFVDGDPFDEPYERSQDFVTALDKASRQVDRIHYSPAGQSEGVTVDRIVVVFDVPKGKTGQSICKGQRVGAAPEDDSLSFRAVVCKGPERLGEVEGRLPSRPASAGDHGLEQLFQDAAIMLVRGEDKTPH